jgi:xylulokinase
MFLLGYDIGSSTIKAALVNAETHATVAVVQYPDQDMDMIARQGGWAEQQPEVWWQNLCMATRRLLAQTGAKPIDIKGIGISYQMHGLVLIDAEQQVLRPSIIWCDSRAVALGQQAFQDIGTEFCLGNLLNSPGNFTASKLKWVKDNEPETYDAIWKVLLPGDFIAMRLTGEASTTVSGLSEGIFWDFKQHAVSQKLLEYYGFSENLLADRNPTFSVQGTVTKEAAETTGLAQGTPVTYRAGDQPNNALALNVLKPGEIAATSGTSGVVYGIVDKLLHDPKSRVNAFAHVNYEDNFDRIGILLCLNGAGIQYSWMKHQVGLAGRSYADMERMASTVAVGAEGLCILPFGNGSERILEDRAPNAHIFNLQFNRHTRAHLYRASLEGVAFSFVYGVNVLKSLGLGVDVMRVGNDNMFQSKLFSTTIATLLDCRIEVVDTTGAVGAARAAGVGARLYRSLSEAVEGIRPSVVHEPRLNSAQCKQAYNYWLSCLDKALDDRPRREPGSAGPGFEWIEHELAEKDKTISALAFRKTAQDDLLSNLKETLAALGKKHPALRKDLEKATQKIENNLDARSDWSRFEESFDRLGNEFFKKLKTKFPLLTPSELKMCALLKMNRSSKEMAQQLNISVRGVETRRYRLRRRLGLEQDANLFSFLDKFG